MIHYFDSGETYDSGILYDGSADPMKRMDLRLAQNATGLTPSEFASAFQLNVDGVAAHVATFTNQDPTSVECQACIDDLVDAIMDVGTTVALLAQKRQIRDAKFALAKAKRKALAGYVEGKADGDASIVLLANFDLAKAPTPSAPLPMPKVDGNKLVTGEDEGTALGTWEKVEGAHGFEVQVTLSADLGPWVHYKIVTKPEVEVTGQTSGQKRWTRVRAFNDLGEGPWSDPACAMIP
jgi:hypothetical protein